MPSHRGRGERKGEGEGEGAGGGEREIQIFDEVAEHSLKCHLIELVEGHDPN